MKIILNHHIIFDFDAGTIFSTESHDDFIQMSNPAKRLLYLLLSHPGEVISREILFKKVWDDFGMISSNNNLNQCISKLRRILRNFNPEDEIIITVPKVGFMLHRQVIVEEIAEQDTSTEHNSTDSSLPLPASPWMFTSLSPWRYPFYVLFFAISFLSLMISVSLISIYKSYNHEELFIGLAGNCNVEADDKIDHQETTQDFKKELLNSLQRLNLRCNNKQYVLLARSSSFSTSSQNTSRYHLLLCEKIAASKSDVCWPPQPSIAIN